MSKGSAVVSSGGDGLDRRSLMSGGATLTALTAMAGAKPLGTPLAQAPQAQGGLREASPKCE